MSIGIKNMPSTAEDEASLGEGMQVAEELDTDLTEAKDEVRAEALDELELEDEVEESTSATGAEDLTAEEEEA